MIVPQLHPVDFKNLNEMLTEDYSDISCLFLTNENREELNYITVIFFKMQVILLAKEQNSMSVTTNLLGSSELQDCVCVCVCI